VLAIKTEKTYPPRITKKVTQKTKLTASIKKLSLRREKEKAPETR